MQQIDLLIAQLDLLLREHRPDYYAKLLPGASEEQLGQAEASFGNSLPPALRALYLWRNGQPFDYYKPLYQNMTWMPLESVAGAHETLTELLDGGEFDRVHWWEHEWLPFLEDGAGNHVCLDLAGSFTGLAGQVLEFWHDDEGRVVLAPSVEAWLDATVQALKLVVEEEGGFGPDTFVEWSPILPGYPKKYQAGSPQ